MQLIVMILNTVVILSPYEDGCDSNQVVTCTSIEIRWAIYNKEEHVDDALKTFFHAIYEKEYQDKKMQVFHQEKA